MYCPRQVLRWCYVLYPVLTLVCSVQLLGRRRWAVAAASLMEEVREEAVAEVSTSGSLFQATTSTQATSSTSTSSSSSVNPTAKLVSSKWALDENELLASTAEHRFWTLGTMGLMAAGFTQALQHMESGSDAGIIVAAFVVAYILADLGTGIYHWGVDNYGDGTTPVFGRQIAAFQGHHQKPWTITQRQFCNNVHQVFKPAAFPSACVLAVSHWMPLWAQAFLPSFLFLVCMSQQFHAWSHMKKSELPGYIIALQDAHILISRKAHGAHHKPNFDGNYCIVSGLWNPVLDNSGFFRWLEEVIAAGTGVEPRCWYPPQEGWEETVAPDSSM
eukprot:jgi/Chrzof1/3075/Cz12g10230.t1_FADA[v5.2]